jgi:NAD(P)-dependent dehydrogenase (short-subunit alcohol dehydrogenase family)
MPELPKLFDLHDRVAVITGGAGLLGSEFCLTLAEAGASVVAADSDQAALDQLVETLHQNGFDSIGVTVDVSKPESVNQMIQETVDTYGRLDILVNSAALDPKFDPQHGGNVNSFEDYPLEAWNQALGVNLTGMFLCCQAAVKKMLEQGKGVIVNLCSIYGITAPDQRLYQRQGQPAQYKPAYYPVSKAGILGLTNYLAAYYAGKNIRVNALSPGGVYNKHDEEFVRAYSARTVLGRMANKGDMNGALLFLVSDASAYMTGANLVIDGGWSTW